MKLFICGALMVGAAMPSFAAKRILMESTDLATNKITQREILIDNTRLRVNDGNTSIIFLSDGGNRMLILDKTRNEYRVMDQKTMDQMAAQMAGVMSQMDAAMKSMPPEQRAMMEKMLKGKMPGAAAAVSVPTVYTAKGSGSASGYACTKYEGMQGSVKVVDLCAALGPALKLGSSDLQVYEKMREFSAGMVKAVQNSPMASMIPATDAQTGIQGLPLEETLYSEGKATRKEVTKSITDVSATDADFSTGTAKKMDMPTMPGAAKGK